MTIEICKHFLFACHANLSEVYELKGFCVGEIVRDWHGDVGCILTISKYGDVRTDSNGMGHISKLKKVRSRKTIEAYINQLHKADIHALQQYQDFELSLVRENR